MPNYGAINRRNLIRYLKKAGYEGPYSGGKHQYLVKGQLKLALPNPHQAEIGVSLLARILKQAGITRQEWEKL
jgi:predicted RNA binding protein YcfA (HicA-like mRNA interferase family)